MLRGVGADGDFAELLMEAADVMLLQTLAVGEFLGVRTSARRRDLAVDTSAARNGNSGACWLGLLTLLCEELYFPLGPPCLHYFNDCESKNLSLLHREHRGTSEASAPLGTRPGLVYIR